MTDRRAALIATMLLGAALIVPVPAAAASADDIIPGVAMPASPASDSVDAATDQRDVFSVALSRGDTLTLSLSRGAGATADCDLDLYLYGPGTPTADHASAIAATALPLHDPESLAYTAPADGTYYVEVFAYRGSGPYSLTWTRVPEPLLPIHRFFNAGTGTHFYTSSSDEVNTVIANYSNVFRYEGIAYYTRPSRNPQPLYRFYNLRNGSHFYTASAAERDTVIAQWGSTFRYEGPSYNVSLSSGAGAMPVYRFYNVRNGSHFYTASPDEVNAVLARYGWLYRFEGPAFYVGQ